MEAEERFSSFHVQRSITLQRKQIQLKPIQEKKGETETVITEIQQKNVEK
jgi:hypothetical protein